jgi:CubicO group peptidase (beta-lactamase class C family)
MLAEIVRRLDPSRRPFADYIREEIFAPLGMNDCYFAMSQSQFADFGDRMGHLAITGGKPAKAIQFDSPEQSMTVVPGASCRGPIRQLGLFYEMLLSRDRFLWPQTVEAITARHRAGLFDLTFQHIVDWGLGFIVNSAQYGEQTVPYGFGPHASRRAFGHGGSQSSAGIADPEYGLVVAVVFNGMAGEVAHNQRIRALLKAIYEDLQLSTQPAAPAPAAGESGSTSGQNG